MKFSTLEQIIACCREDQGTIGQLMLNEQIKETGKSKEETFKQMADYYGIMKEAVHRGIHEPVP
ncbi:L-serine ammonia-lyase, iron-sulfur-dependent, subunit alpha, partial [Clostridium perfringens]